MTKNMGNRHICNRHYYFCIFTFIFLSRLFNRTIRQPTKCVVRLYVIKAQNLQPTQIIGGWLNDLPSPYLKVFLIFGFKNFACNDLTFRSPWETKKSKTQNQSSPIRLILNSLRRTSLPLTYRVPGQEYTLPLRNIFLFC